MKRGLKNIIYFEQKREEIYQKSIKAFIDGYQSFKNGMSLDESPHHDENIENSDWNEGWSEAWEDNAQGILCSDKDLPELAGTYFEK